MSSLESLRDFDNFDHLVLPEVVELFPRKLLITVTLGNTIKSIVRSMNPSLVVNFHQLQSSFLCIILSHNPHSTSKAFSWLKLVLNLYHEISHKHVLFYWYLINVLSSVCQDSNSFKHSCRRSCWFWRIGPPALRRPLSKTHTRERTSGSVDSMSWLCLFTEVPLVTILA